MKTILFAALASAASLGAMIVMAQGRGPDTPPAPLTLKQELTVPEVDAQSRAMVAAAQSFLDTLDADQRARVVYAFDDNVQRSNWSNFPEGIVARGGLPTGEMSADQKAALDALLATVLSDVGVRNIDWQLAAEDTLGDGGRLQFGSHLYFASFLGEPSEDAPWMFQFGGHHLALNVTVAGPDVTFSPMLTGGQPLNITLDGEDIMITARETEAALALITSLDADQQAQAIRGSRPINLLLGPGEDSTTVAPEGITGAELTADQQALLLDLIAARLEFINADDFAAKMTQVAADLDQTYFGWWGDIGAPGTAYFRVTGPSLVLEYAPQSGRGGDDGSDHAHAMFRNPVNDYGAAWVAE